MGARTMFAAVALCWLAFVGIAVRIAYRQSATGDEVAHVGAGVGYLQGDMRLNREHPPLVKLLAALALGLPSPPKPPAQIDRSTEWTFGHEVLHQGRPGQALALIGRARIPVILLSSLVLLMAALFAYRLAGPLAALAAAFFAACCPLWYAHATLVTTDAAVSAFSLAGALCLHGVMRPQHASRPRRAGVWLGLLALSVALGMASKYSMAVSVIALGLTALLSALPARSWRPMLLAWAALALGGSLGCALAWGWPPSVAAYLDGVRSVGFNHMPNYPFYAFGEFFVGRGSQPLYFARALMVKLEWPLIALGLLGLWRLLSRVLRSAPDAGARADAVTDLACLAIVPGAYLATMSLFAPAIGVRYVLPVVPFAFVTAGIAVAQLWSSPKARVALGLACALELLALTQALQASPIAWFNGLPCRTGTVPACLDDSNVDWGQALPALDAYRDRRFPGTPIRVFQFIQIPLHAYMERATDAQPIESLHPYRALYAASLHLLLRMPRASVFVRAKPLEVVAGSFAIFDLRAIDALPRPPLDGSAQSGPKNLPGGRSVRAGS